jgi:hypothetical protein
VGDCAYFLFRELGPLVSLLQKGKSPRPKRLCTLDSPFGREYSILDSIWQALRNNDQSGPLGPTNSRRGQKKLTGPTESKIITIVFRDSAVLFACSSRNRPKKVALRSLQNAGSSSRAAVTEKAVRTSRLDPGPSSNRCNEINVSCTKTEVAKQDPREHECFSPPLRFSPSRSDQDHWNTLH